MLFTVYIFLWRHRLCSSANNSRPLRKKRACTCLNMSVWCYFCHKIGIVYNENQRSLCIINILHTYTWRVRCRAQHEKYYDNIIGSVYWEIVHIQHLCYVLLEKQRILRHFRYEWHSCDAEQLQIFSITGHYQIHWDCTQIFQANIKSCTNNTA